MRGVCAIAVLLALSGLTVFAVDCVKVRTQAPSNREAEVWYRVPDGYDPSRRALYPVLVYTPFALIFLRDTSCSLLALCPRDPQDSSTQMFTTTPLLA